MKKALLMILALVMATSVIFAQAPIEKKGKVITPKTTTTSTQAGAPVVKSTPAKPAKLAKGQKAITGEIVNLLSAITTPKAPALNKQEAMGMANRGELLAVKAGAKLYLVVMADGVQASKKLADKAGDKITLVGKVVTKGGITMLIVDSF